MSDIYTKICAVSADLAASGIEKGRRNSQQGYQFRGIDDVYNALAPILSRHGLCILPRILSRECVERASAKGGALFYVTVEAEFDFVAASDGSKHIVRTYGEAMDSADKATNKAMSAAYKYACMQAFCIPTEGDNDADATTYDVARNHPNQAAQSDQPQAQPAGDVPMMTEAQAANIRGLLGISLIDPQKICDHYGVTSLTMLTYEQAADAIRRLSAKVGK